MFIVQNTVSWGVKWVVKINLVIDIFKFLLKGNNAFCTGSHFKILVCPTSHDERPMLAIHLKVAHTSS
jgi:hypothetical protein